MRERIQQSAPWRILLPLLTLATALGIAGLAPEQVLVGLLLAGLLAIGVAPGGRPVTARLVSTRRRAEERHWSGVRSCDPDAPGRVRPRAPGLVA